MENTTTGAVIGRFQTPKLHAGHLYLIGTALQECDKVIILLGCQEKKDDRNPYDYYDRWKMIKNVFPQVNIYKLDDKNDDAKWSDNVDFLLIHEKDVILYHSRDSFKDHYMGRHRTKELLEIPGISATQIRNNLNN